MKLFFSLIALSLLALIQSDTCGPINHNQDIPFNDIKKVKGNLEDCCGFCKETPGCRAWAYVDRKKTCFLKRKTGIIWPARNKHWAVMVSDNAGELTCGPVNHGQDIPGHDIATRKGNRDQCCGFCQETPGCKAWAWRKIGKKCFLKDQVGKIVRHPILKLVDYGTMISSASAPTTAAPEPTTTFKPEKDYCANPDVCTYACRKDGWSYNGGLCRMSSNDEIECTCSKHDEPSGCKTPSGPCDGVCTYGGYENADELCNTDDDGVHCVCRGKPLEPPERPATIANCDEYEKWCKDAGGKSTCIAEPLENGSMRMRAACNWGNVIE